MAPAWASATARLAATVDLPTPPLPEATAIVFFTPGIGWASLRPPPLARTFVRQSMPYLADTADRAERRPHIALDFLAGGADGT